MLENKIKDYIKIDENNCVTDINSSIFISSIEGYICIDEGSGDKYSHAQGCYLKNGLIDSNGRYNYKYIDNQLIELTCDEKDVLFPLPFQTIQTTDQQVLNAQMLKDNANIQIELNEVKKDNASLLLQLAELGGILNV